MQNKIKIKKDEILKKKFKKNFKAGYDAYEVDQFFDTLMQFLQYIENEFVNLENNKNILKNENIKYNEKISQQSNKILLLKNEIHEMKEDGYQNQKIIKDISDIRNNIEKMKNDNK